MKKGMLIVTDLAIALLCAAGLFLTLLEDRFRLWATVACYGAAYLLSLGAGWIAARLAGPSWAVAAGALVPRGKVIPPRSLVMGVPGKVVRPVTDQEAADTIANAQWYVEQGREELPALEKTEA